jgi:hypothetical protein
MMAPRRNAARFRPPDAKSKISALYRDTWGNAPAAMVNMSLEIALKLGQGRRYFGHRCLA